MGKNAQGAKNANQKRGNSAGAIKNNNKNKNDGEANEVNLEDNSENILN